MSGSDDAADPRLTAAGELRAAEQTRTPIAPLSSRFPDLDLADAYAIQGINRDLRIAAGERIVGYKIGLTSRAMQEMLGVDTPDVGCVTDRMVVPDGGELPHGDLIAGHIEAEFGFVIGSPIQATKVTREALREAVSHVGLAAEIIDSRIRDWRIGLVDTVADNASSARIVMGDLLAADPARLDALPQARVELYEDGELIGEGQGSAVLGDPLEALRWLAENLSDQDLHLKAGDIVLAGAVHRMQPLRPGAHYEVRAEGFQPVGISVL